MKKVLLFATAMTIAMSSFTTWVSAEPLYSFATDPTSYTVLTGYKVPAKDYVDVNLDMTSKWDNIVSYTDHTTEATALVHNTGETNNTFDSRATLDMSGVAAEWDAFLDAVSGGDPVKRGVAIMGAKLTGTFKLVITASEGVSNSLVEANNYSAAVTWPNITGAVDGNAVNAETYFEKTNTTYDPATNTFTIEMKTKDDSDYNTKLDKYFTAVNEASNKSDYAFVFDVQDSTVPVGTEATYHVDGAFSGYVDITYDGIDSARTGDAVSRVYFGTSGTDAAPENPATDIEYIKITDATPAPTATARPGGGGGKPVATPTPTAVPTSTPTAVPTETTEPTIAPTATPVADPQVEGLQSGAKLNYQDHYAYIIGYPLEGDETLAEVRPTANITRAEVATIFFRLLTDESRKAFWTQDNDFVDVSIEEWFNNAISTAANAGIMNGYDDGTFRPNNPITRAEFATIAARFSKIVHRGEDLFSDINSHWAETAINSAAKTGWVTGYDDGTFSPDKYIIRAEAMTLINRVLYRLVDDSSISDDTIRWIDNPKGTWYYANVQEATDSHTYEREAIGYVETWVGDAVVRDWEALEKENSKPQDVGSAGSVDIPVVE